MQKIPGLLVNNPGDLMGYTKTKVGKSFIQDQNFIETKHISYSTVLVNTGYGWFWIDNQIESYADDFFPTEKEAFDDLKVFRSSN